MKSTWIRAASAAAVMLLGALTPLAVANAGAAGPVVGAADPIILFLDGSGGFPGELDGSSFQLEGRKFTVSVGYLERVVTDDVPLIGSQSVETRGERSETRFGSGTGAGSLGDHAVFAAYPTPGRGSPTYTFEGNEGLRASLGRPGDLTPREGDWAKASGDAFHHRLTGSHVVVTLAAGVHVLEGNFTLYVWDADFSLVDDGGAQSFRTGVTRTLPAGPVSEERWVWARVEVTEGRLTLRGDLPVQVHAPTFDLTVQDASGLEETAVSAGNLPPGSYRFSTEGHALSVQSLAPASTAVGAVAPGPTGRSAAWTAVAAATTAVVLLGVFAYVVGRNWRRRAEPDANVEPGIAGFLRRGRAAVGSKEWERAVAWFECALALDPRLSVAHLSRGLCLEALGRYAEAHRAFAKAASTAPGDPTVFYHYARSFLWGGLAGEALNALQFALARDPALAAKAREDPAFSPLRDHPLFLALIGTL